VYPGCGENEFVAGGSTLEHREKREKMVFFCAPRRNGACE
jgi:hypothetical protein